MNMIKLLAISAALAAAAASAQTSDYKGQEARTIKSLSEQEVQELLAGQGMGLAKALRWVEASGGSVRLESKPGAGTRVVTGQPETRRRSATSSQRAWTA